MLYRPYRDRCRSTALCRELEAKIADVMQDLKNYARTEEQTIATADKLYDLADYALSPERTIQISRRVCSCRLGFLFAKNGLQPRLRSGFLTLQAEAGDVIPPLP